MKRLQAAAIIFFIAAAAFTIGCQKHAGFVLAPQAVSGQGYAAEGAEAVFENKAVRISARQLKNGEAGEGFLSKLQAGKHILFILSIQNKSGVKVIYKPNYTVFTNDVLDYLKPLDYTDLYMYDDHDGLDAVKDKVYDLDVNLDPGKSASAVLIFRPASGEFKKAWLEIQDLYIGTDAVKLTLPFIAKPEV